MNLTTLQYFIDVYENLSFSKAAEKNFVSQTAISFQIKTLENELRTVLFFRNQKPIKATEQADFLYKHSKELLNSWNYIQEHIMAINNRPLRFTYSFHGGAHLLIDLMTNLNFEQLKTKIDFTPLDSGNSAEAISQYQADIAIISEHEIKNLPNNCTVQFLHSVDYLVALSQEHTLSEHSALSFSQLPFEELIILKTMNSGRQKNFITLFDYLEKHEFDFSNNRTAPDFQTMLLYVLENEGIAIIPSHINIDIFKSRIKTKPILNSTYRSNLYLITRKEHASIAQEIINQYTKNQT